MILVLLGTQNYKFKRIIEYTLKLVNEVGINKNIIIQCGNVDYSLEKFKNDKTQVLFESYLNDYDKLIKEADLIVCHSGVGIIMDCLKYNKKIITVPRKVEFNEHVDDHQQEIAQELASKNYLFQANDYEEFKSKYFLLVKHEFDKYISNTEKFNEQLNELIENILGD